MTRVGGDSALGSCVHPGTLRLCGRLLLESGGQHTCDWGQVDLGKSSLVLWGRFIPTSSHLYLSYYPHRSRELVSPVCGIFFQVLLLL